MKCVEGYAGFEVEIPNLFESVFTASEGVDEGQIIRRFVDDLMVTTPDTDLFVYVALDKGNLLGCIFFSRLEFAGDVWRVCLLSPVAVRTDRQRAGVGQKLIAYGLDDLRGKGFDIAVTYGDPEYYRKTGFMPVSQDVVPAPLLLNHPHGWLGQSLHGSDLTPVPGPSRCVPALNKPELW